MRNDGVGLGNYRAIKIPIAYFLFFTMTEVVRLHLDLSLKYPGITTRISHNLLSTVFIACAWLRWQGNILAEPMAEAKL